MTIKEKTIIEEYRELTEKIEVIKSCITTTKRDITKLINTYRPNDIGAIDYSKPAVQISMYQEDINSVFKKIHDLETDQQELEIELQSLYDQRNKLERAINDLGDKEKKAMMLRIKGYPNWKIAKQMSYSQRQVERIFKNIREKQKDVGEMSV